jgi:ribonuclease BN (tRNA processing enzyme)
MSQTQHKLGPSGDLGALPLTNDGALELTFVGAGSAFSKKYFQNNVLIVQGDDHVLVDCGTRAPEALSLLGLSVMDVRNYLITHSHADHIGGLEEVMLVNRYVGRKKPTLIAPRKYRKLLWEKSLKGGNAYNERKDGLYLELEDFWDIVEPEPIRGATRELSFVRLGSLRIDIFRTMHIPDSAADWKSSALSYGIVINESIAYTSDTRFDRSLIDFLEKRYTIDTIFHDCQMFTGGVHASLDELATLPAEIKAKMHLMHYGDAALAQPDRATNLGFAGFVEQWHSYRF